MNHLKRIRSMLTIVILMGVFSSTMPWTVAAQSVTTRLTGVVKDPAGAVVPETRIILIDAATGRERATTSDEDGGFAFNDVIAGIYKIAAEHTDFKRTKISDVKVDVNVPAFVTVALEIGQVSETVTVTGSEAQATINTETAELQSTVQRQQIVDLPLNGRNPLTLAGLQAGVASSGATRSASVNGLRGSFTNLTWDGININDNFVRTDSFFGVAAPTVEGVSEFTLTTQNAGPDQGLGVVQTALITPRGSNEFHGSLFNFHRNDVFDANSFFNNATGLENEKLIRNQFGFNVGGPVPVGFLDEKLFFYVYYQGTRERREDERLRTVLTDPIRQGLFTYRRADTGQIQTVNLFALSGLSPDPTVAGLLGLTPLPNNLDVGDELNTAGFRFNSGVKDDDNLWGFRLDFNANNNNKFEAIYSRFTSDFPNDTFNDIGEPFPGLEGGGQKSVRPRGSFAWLWTPTSYLANEVRFGFNKYSVDFVNIQDFAEGYRLDFPLVTEPVQNFLPQGRPVDVYEVIDNASFVRDRHTFSFGGNLRWVFSQPFNDAGIVPLYTLGFNTTGNPNPLSRGLFPGGIATTDFNNASSLLALLSGTVASGAQTFNVTSRDSGFVAGAGNIRDVDYYTLGLYAGDSWRMKPNFTLNLGLRWEFLSVPTEASGLALLPVGGPEALADPNATLDFFGSGTGRRFFNNDWNNFAPNINFAWDPWNDGKTSIRAGFAISYAIDSNITTVRNAFNGNDGLSQGITLNNTSGTVSGGGIAPIPLPDFQVPRTIADNIALDTQAALFTIDPNLRTPYVQQWNFGIQRELFADLAFEVRYVGNRAVKLTRGVDTNQVQIFNNGFLEDFRRAERNLAANGNPAVGEPLEVFPLLGLGGLLGNSTIRSLISTGEVGQLAATYLINRDLFLVPGVNGAQVGPGFFVQNPNAFVTDIITNGSFSNYNGLQTEIRRRWRNGLYLQANYTYSKSLTDFEGSQTNFSGLLDNAAALVLEKKRALNDITHVFNANWVFDLPFGPNRRFLSDGLIGRALGGWRLGGIWQWQSGRPISIISGRGTLNRTGRSGKNTVNTPLSISELQEFTGTFLDEQGRPVLFDPRLIGSDGRANSEFFQNPESGTVGSLGLTPVSGPGFFRMDMNLMKRFYITEEMNIEFRAEAFNIWNNVNFFVPENHNINSTSFGRITDTFDPRILQFALKFNF